MTSKKLLLIEATDDQIMRELRARHTAFVISLKNTADDLGPITKSLHGVAIGDNLHLARGLEAQLAGMHEDIRDMFELDSESEVEVDSDDDDNEGDEWKKKGGDKV